MRSPGRYVSRGVCSRNGSTPSVRSRSTMRLLPFSKRRTVPLMSLPLRSLNSLKMRSRSSSRTRWRSTCLAVCAAMRPNAARACFTRRRSPNSLSCSAAFFASAGCQKIWKPSSSPSSASSPACCASSSAISRSSSDGSSTTVMYWKRSTWPVSSLNRASSSRFGPNTLCAAFRIASSIVFTRRERSIPFSLATMSIAWSRFMSGACGADCVAMIISFSFASVTPSVRRPVELSRCRRGARRARACPR